MTAGTCSHLIIMLGNLGFWAALHIPTIPVAQSWLQVGTHTLVRESHWNQASPFNSFKGNFFHIQENYSELTQNALN